MVPGQLNERGHSARNRWQVPAASRALRVSGVAEAGIDWVAPRGEMGGGILAEAGLCPDVLPVGIPNSAKASRDAARMMVSLGVDLIVFAGGDGTARDIAGVVGSRVPLLGIPCGVKMHSGVFAIRPEAAGRLIAVAAKGATARIAFRLAEIMDIDEEALREGRLDVRLYDHVRIPYIRDLIQNAKSAPSVADEVMLDALGKEVADEWEDGTTYLIGPGTTAKRPIEALGLKPALLGFGHCSEPAFDRFRRDSRLRASRRGRRSPLHSNRRYRRAGLCIRSGKPAD